MLPCAPASSWLSKTDVSSYRTSSSDNLWFAEFSLIGQSVTVVRHCAQRGCFRLRGGALIGVADVLLAATWRLQFICYFRETRSAAKNCSGSICCGTGGTNHHGKNAQYILSRLDVLTWSASKRKIIILVILSFFLTSLWPHNIQS